MPVSTWNASEHLFMETEGPEAEGFQFRVDQMRKRGTVAFDGQKRKIVRIG